MTDDPPHPRQDTWHEACPVKTVMPDRESLPAGAQQHLLVGDEPLKPDTMDVDAVDNSSASPGIVHRRVRYRPHASSGTGSGDPPSGGR